MNTYKNDRFEIRGDKFILLNANLVTQADTVMRFVLSEEYLETLYKEACKINPLPYSLKDFKASLQIFIFEYLEMRESDTIVN